MKKIFIIYFLIFFCFLNQANSKISSYSRGQEVSGFIQLNNKTKQTTKQLNTMDQKKKEKCKLVICLSHLGIKYKTNKISDIKLAAKTKDIDLIIGGHTHTSLKEPVRILNFEKKEVLINQVGWGGINLGKIDFHFSQNGIAKKVFSSSIFIKNNKKNA